jgi:hypothetical protein
VPHPRDETGLGEGTARAHRAHRGAGEDGRGVVPGLGQGTGGLELRCVSPLARANARPSSPPGRVLRAIRRPLRHPARRLRAGHADRGGSHGLRRPRAGARRPRRRVRDRRGRAVPARAVLDRRAAGAVTRDPGAHGRHTRGVPAGHDRAPVRDPVRPQRHPAHDALRGGRPVALHAAHEGGHGVYEHGVSSASPNAARSGLLVCPRVADGCGERRRPIAAVLALVLPAGPGDAPTSSAPSRWSASIGPSIVRSVVIWSTRTRPRTACTSSSASSSSRTSSPAGSR